MAPNADGAAATVCAAAAACELADWLRARGWRMASAESCTGGLVAAACTDLPGSSDWFDRGFVTYANAAKADMLGVPAVLIAAHGAVSQPVAEAMAQGALAHAGVQCAVATTGVAGPGGGSAAKPVGTVWMAASVAQAGCGAGVFTVSECHRFAGERASVRAQAVAQALRLLLKALRAHQKT